MQMEGQSMHAIFGVAIVAIPAAAALILGLSALLAIALRRMSAQHRLVDNERRMLRILIDTIPDYMYVKDLDSKFVVANARLAAHMGFATPDAMLGKSDTDFYPAELAQAFRDDELAVIRTGQPLIDREEITTESHRRRKYTLTTKVPIRDAAGRITGIAGVGRDVTAPKAAEDALREAEAKYRRLFSEAVVGIFELAPDGLFLNANPAMATLFGYPTPEEMIADLNLASPACHASAAGCDDFNAALASGLIKDFECQVLRKDGTATWGLFNIRAVLRDGATIRYEGMGKDISERKHLREQLLQAQKLEAVGQLAAGIAHEINTPTQYIEHNLHFLSDAVGDLRVLLRAYDKLLAAADANALTRETIDEVKSAALAADTEFLLAEIPKTIVQMFEGVAHVSTLVGAMKEFSHPGKKEKVFLDLNRAIENTIAMARNEWKYVAALETSLDPALPPVRCQPGEFNQVMLILIVNAAQPIGGAAAGKGATLGKIAVQTRAVDGWVEIRVQDSGPGIPEAVRNRIFDPFFTTKEIGKGTGQGLAIARSVVVDKHAGAIEFITGEGKGTTFIVRLPIDCRMQVVNAVAA